MIATIQKKVSRKRRQKRIRARIHGTARIPRLAIFRSHYALYAQLIDDALGKTILASSVKGKNMAAARTLGNDIVKKIKSKKITRLVYDRGGYQYHGVVATIADVLREGGVHV